MKGLDVAVVNTKAIQDKLSVLKSRDTFDKQNKETTNR